MNKIFARKKHIAGLWAAVICLSLFTILLFGCNSIPDHYEIDMGCGGGFVGKFHSYRVIKDGTVYYCAQSFTSQDYKEEGTPIGNISPKDVKKFYSRLMAAGFNDINYDDPDDMSCTFGLNVLGEEHNVTWPMELNRITPPDAIKPVIDIFKDIEKLVSPLRKKHEEKNIDVTP